MPTDFQTKCKTTWVERRYPCIYEQNKNNKRKRRKKEREIERERERTLKEAHSKPLTSDKI